MAKAKQKAKALGRAEHAATRAATDHRNRPLIKLLGQASEIADQPPLVAISATTLAIGLLAGRRPVARAGARMLAAHALATGIKTIIKGAVDRTRPAEAEKRGQHHSGKGTGTGRSELNSFPSGHTAGAVAVTRAISREASAATWPGAAATVAVAAIQLPRGKHYLSDVAAGGIIGWVAEAAVNRAVTLIDAAVARRTLSRRRPPPLADRPGRSAPR